MRRHRILIVPAARDALQEVIEEVGGYAERFVDVPAADWALKHEHIGPEDPWFYPGVDLNVVYRLRN